MNASLKRMAEVEALCRHVNERIAETAERFDADRAEFCCECLDATCDRQLEVPLADYEEVRSDSTHFLLVPGHEDRTVERVVARGPRYAVVAKVGHAVASAVRRLDPRARPS